MCIRADREQPGVPAALAAGGFRFCRLLPLMLVALAAVTIVATGWHRQLSLESLVRHRAEIDAFVAANFVAALVAFVAVYVWAVALSLPGAVFLTISGGMVFGAVAGAAAAVIGGTVGATLLFVMARSALGGWLARRIGPLAERLAENFRRDAFSYILFLRLVPIFPFWIVNLVPALAGTGLMPFVAATAIGVIPATIAFALLGAGLDSALAAQAAAYTNCLAAAGSDCHLDFDLKAAATPELITALMALSLIALLPVVLRRIKSRRARKRRLGTPAERPPK
jgi:uncharacterized membrane protein YdjX (TVP38/TMEM64 family)